MLESLSFDSVPQLLLFFQEQKNCEENLSNWEQISIDFKHNERLIRNFKKESSDFTSQTYEKSVSRLRGLQEQRKESFDQSSLQVNQIVDQELRRVTRLAQELQDEWSVSRPVNPEQEFSLSLETLD